MVDRAAKEVAEGMSDSRERLPIYLAKLENGLPVSLLAIKQTYNVVMR